MTARSFSSCPLPINTRHYLLRNDVMVPLIPIDLLPVLIQGVPCQLSHRQMSEEGWKFVDETKEQTSLLTLLAPTAPHHQPANLSNPKHLPPDHDIRREAAILAKDKPLPSHTSRPQSATNVAVVPPPCEPYIIERTSTLADSFTPIYPKDVQRPGYRLPYPSGIEPDQTKKEYCTYWIRTGECDYMSIGCKYKHEMPPVEKLRELGFTLGTPKWFQEKAAIAARGPTWMQRRLAERTGSHESANESAASDISDNLPMSRSRSADTCSHAYQHDPSRGLVHTSLLGPTLTSRLEYTSPAAPSTSCIPDLLIDVGDLSLEDSTIPLSTQSSASSVSNTETGTTTRSTKKDHVRQTVRYCSPSSFTSESEEEVKAPKPLLKRTTTTHKPAMRTAPPKQATLSSSKYAAAGKRCHAVYNSQAPLIQYKNNTARALGVQTKIATFKQKDVHYKEKLGRNTATFTGYTRFVPKTATPVKKIAV